MHCWSSLQLVYESLLPSLLLVFNQRQVSYIPEAKYNDYFLCSLVRPNSKDHAYSCWNRHTSHTHHTFLTVTGLGTIDPSSYGYLNNLVSGISVCLLPCRESWRTTSSEAILPIWNMFVIVYLKGIVPSGLCIHVNRPVDHTYPWT